MIIMPGELKGLSPAEKFNRIRQKEVRTLHDAHVYAKDQKWTKLWGALGWIMRVLTGGKVKSQQDAYITTIGNYIFYPAGWRASQASEPDCAALRHELCHVRQYRKLGFGNVWLGFIIFLFLYLFVFLPAGLSWFRWVFEREAYREGWYAAKEFDLKWRPRLGHYIDCCTSYRYVWAWPFRSQVRRWFYKNCQ